MLLFHGGVFVGYAARPYTHPLTAMDMLPGKLPIWVDSTFGCERMAVPNGAQRFWAKTWNLRQPPDMPAISLEGGEADAAGEWWTYFHHQGTDPAAATVKTTVTMIPANANARPLSLPRLSAILTGSPGLG